MSKTLLSEEELLVTKERDKVRKVSKRVSETCEQTLHRQEQNRTHLACVKGSAFQCCYLHKQAHDQRGIAEWGRQSSPSYVILYVIQYS